MNDRDAFLRAMQDAPEDDTPRLVYADFLEENGDTERAAFIRLQCRLVKGNMSTPEARELCCDEADLIVRHRRKWLGALADWEGVRNWAIRRGFVERVELSVSAFVEHADELASLHPLIRELEILPEHPATFPRATEELPRALAGWPLAGWLRRLTLSGVEIGDRGLRVLLASPLLDRLEGLALISCGITDAGDAALRRDPRFSRLKHVNLRGNRIRSETPEEEDDLWRDDGRFWF